MQVVRLGDARDSQEVERQMRGSGGTHASGADPPPSFFESVDSAGVTEEFSISADSKALAEMEPAVSPLLTIPMDQ